MKLVKHFKTINKHKYFVYKCSKISGITWQGITHDLSKYSILELKNGAKYYTGTHSPIDEERKQTGICVSWLQHKAKNKHHWEYWIDFVKGEPVPRKMPIRYAKEFICDYVAASIVYGRDKVDFDKPFSVPLEYFATSNKMLHEETETYIRSTLVTMAKFSINAALQQIKNDTSY